uniref:Leucine rich repeats-containing protein n=1 Tax=Trepomonas sp. PC1 TaxID=1076344 RepID=A0A146KGK2_9EUKA|eukprot:JAP95900.1 Leucine rich repeats-containing protein [Trepomonas sp. PC1]
MLLYQTESSNFGQCFKNGFLGFCTLWGSEICVDELNQKIPEHCFRNCSSLQRGIFHSVQEIEKEAFYDCNSLDYMEIPLIKKASLEQICTKQIVTFNPPVKFEQVNPQKVVQPFSDQQMKIRTVYVRQCKLMKIRLSNVETIPEAAFECNFYLIYIDLPKTKFIKAKAFNECKQLMEVSGNRIQSVGRSCFNECYQLSAINLSNLESIGQSAFNRCFSLNNINLQSVKQDLTQDSHFENCTFLKRVKFITPFEIAVQSQNVGHYGKFSFVDQITIIKKQLKQLKLEMLKRKIFVAK